MSPKKDPDVPKKPGPDAKSSGVKTPFSRRGFLSGLGIGSGAIGTGILTTGLAEPAAAAAGGGTGAGARTHHNNRESQEPTNPPPGPLCGGPRKLLRIYSGKRDCGLVTR